MNILLLTSFFIIVYLRKKFQTATLIPWWNKKLLGIMFACIALQVLEITFPSTKQVTTVLSHLIILGILGIIYLEEVFDPARPTVFAVLPLILVSFVGSLLRLISIDFYNDWVSLFGTAKAFAIVWMITMLIINKRQKKALEKERLKTQEEERQNKIMATLKAELEIQVTERTVELTNQKAELEHALADLKSTQAQLIQSEKLASLGELTAGIAHEIQNPLNFVNNFAEVNTELIEEMKLEIARGNIEEVTAIANDIKANELKISHHGKRADAIVKGMLQHSRNSLGTKEPVNINELVDEYLRLAYHGLRAKDKSFNATMKTDFDDSIGSINLIPQDIGRAILNLITNAFYAVTEKKKDAHVTPDGGIETVNNTYEPTIALSTKKMGSLIEIKVKDNGNGIPQKILGKIFQPFFTTKPTGKGTGLGLSLSYDIIKAHNGEIKVTTKEGEGTEFLIQLPVK